MKSLVFLIVLCSFIKVVGAETLQLENSPQKEPGYYVCFINSLRSISPWSTSATESLREALYSHYKSISAEENSRRSKSLR